MSRERPCDRCKRPLWDGGHALNERECSEPGGEICRLNEIIGRQYASLLKIRETERRWREGNISRGEREGDVADAVRTGLNESIPAGSIFIQSWCGGEQSDYARLFRASNRLIEERDRANAVVAVAQKIATCTAGGSQIIFGDVPEELGTELQAALAEYVKPLTRPA